PVPGARSVLDVGWGSARLTLALADAGATQVVGVDASLDRLTQGRARISTHAVGGRVQLFEADFDRALPFATLRELRRVTAPGERIVTALWAPVGENAWFALPRAAAAAVLGNDRADYARSFGRLGSLDEATEVHRAAGLTDVRAETLRNKLDVQHAAGLWRWMVSQNGHVRRLDASLTASERAAVLDELHRRAAEHRADDGSLALARAMTLVIATA